MSNRPDQITESEKSPKDYYLAVKLVADVTYLGGGAAIVASLVLNLPPEVLYKGVAAAMLAFLTKVFWWPLWEKDL